jgi:hypothetical protein
MTTYTQSAFYKVRKWMIQELYDNGILNPSNYTQSSPIVPIQQVPETDDNIDAASAGLPVDAPFIVWDILVPGTYETDFWNCRDEVMLWIYDYDIEKLMEIKEFLYDLFHRFDLSAEDINNFEDPDSPFQYHYFDIMMGLPTDETDQVLGRYGINMVIMYEYTRPLLENGRFA